jgi:hypothetical protein
MSFGIWNNLDDAALYLGVSRLDYESDEVFYNRIKKFGKWKYRPDYFTQVHSLPLQIGLDFRTIMEIKSASDKRIEYVLDWEYFTLETFNDDGSTNEYIRVFINTPDCTLEKITDLLDSSEDIEYLFFKENYKNYSTKNLIRNKNTFVKKESISSKNSNLENKNIIKGSFRAINTQLFKREVDSLQDLKKDGDYFIDYENGYVETFTIPTDVANITYKFFKKNIRIEHTDLNLIPLNIISKYGVTDKFIDLVPYILAGNVWGK